MPTLRHEKVIERIIENNGNVSKSMREVGYSEGYARNPHLLTKQKDFKKLLEKALPDNLLLRIHKQGLRATTKKPHLIDRDDKGRPVYEYVDEVDFAVRHKYLETAYKVKGKLIDEQGGNKTLIINVTGETAKRYGITPSPNTETSST